MLKKAICLLIVVTSALAQEEELTPEDDFVNPRLADILNERFPLISALLERSAGPAHHSSYYASVYPPVQAIYVPMPVPESYPWWDKLFSCKHKKKKDKFKEPLKTGDEEESEEKDEEASNDDDPGYPPYPPYPPYHPQYPPYPPPYPPYPLPPPPPYYPPTTTTTEKTTTTTKPTTKKPTTTEAPTTTTTTKKPKPHHPDYYPPPPEYYPPPPDYHQPGYHPYYPPPTTTTTTTTTTTPKPKPKPTKPLWWTIIFSTPKPTKKTDTKRKLDRPQASVGVSDSSEVEELKEESIQERPELEYDEDDAEPTEKLELEEEDPWAIPV